MSYFDIVNKGNRTTEILLYGYIETWGSNSSKNLSVRLRELDKENDVIKIRMNCYGGSVIEAVAIYETIKRLSAETIVDIEGIAASAASFVLLGANTVRIGNASRIMLHQFSTFIRGNYYDLRDEADTLEKWEDDWIKLYANKMNMSAKKTKAKYFQRSKDTWINATDAVKLNLANEVIDGLVQHDLENIDTSLPIQNIFNTYQNAISINNSKSKTMENEQLKIIGLPENATKEQITAKLKEMAKNSTPEPKKPTTEGADNSDPNVIALQNQVAALQKQGVDKVLNAAIEAKKITAGEKTDWEETAEHLGLEKVAKMINALPGATLPNDVIKPKNKVEGEYESLEDLMNKGHEVAEAYKASNPAEFKALWKKEYGTEYTGD